MTAAKTTQAVSAVSKAASRQGAASESESRHAADVESARRVLRLEAEGISAAATALDSRFGDAVDALAGIMEPPAQGRIIVTGMGKSGHVARKLAATFASTGSPAHYVHPSEASHGDLGMIGGRDAVIALSNSGETAELRDLLEYTKRHSIPLIAITGKQDSTLGEMADHVLLLPPVPEGCPMGLAPTTSTTVSLALGDALAVALLERRGFSAQDFRLLHPGGKLGSSLMRVSDLMHSGEDMPLVPRDMPMSEVLIEITAKRFGCVGIVDAAGLLLGIITDGDLRRHMGGDLFERTAGEVMTRDPMTIRPKALAAEALAVMNDRSITNLFVASERPEGREPVGILHIHDCLRAGVA